MTTVALTLGTGLKRESGIRPETCSSETVANIATCLIHQTNYLLEQILALKKKCSEDL